MKKQERKELSESLSKLIDSHLSHHNPKAANRSQKTIRAAAKEIAKKFVKALKKAENVPAAKTGKKPNAARSVSKSKKRAATIK